MIKYQYINWKSNLNWQVPAVFVIYIKWWSDDKISCGQFVRRTLSCFRWQCHLQKVGINLHNNDSLWVNTSDAWFSFGFQTLRLLFDKFYNVNVHCNIEASNVHWLKSRQKRKTVILKCKRFCRLPYIPVYNIDYMPQNICQSKFQCSQQYTIASSMLATV